jgi:DNA modification methylase
LPKGHPDKAREIGQEPTPEAYVETMVGVFREVKRCLHDSGTLWLNVGDSYANTNQGHNSNGFGELTGANLKGKDNFQPNRKTEIPPGLKPKDLCGIPWRLVLALQADGWYWRSCIVWHKKSCMPESVTDRPTNSWEPIFLLAKSQRYFMDMEAVKEKSDDPNPKPRQFAKTGNDDRQDTGRMYEGDNGMRNQRNVWTLGPEPYSDAHFATYPTEIPRRAILAGTSARGCCPKCYAPWERQVERTPATSKKCPKTDGIYQAQGGNGAKKTGTIGMSGGGRIDGKVETLGWYPSCRCNNDDDDYEVMPIPCTVLDPFGGSGTTGSVALELGRHAILCELNDAYLPLINTRTNVTPGLQLA